MAGVKLSPLDQLRIEISHYIGIPYWMNTVRNGKVVSEGVLGGKGTSREIAFKTIEIANENKIKLAEFSNQQFYNFQKKHHIGIDCSGLAYHLLDFYYNLLKKKSIVDLVIGVNDSQGNPQKGVRKVNADLLTGPKNSLKVDNYDDIKTADLIRMDNGKHVIFIIEKEKNTIYYVHSSSKTFDRGVHYGTIAIIDPSKTLNYQEWSDKTLSGKSYSELFHPENGDGIFRLKILK